MDKKFKAKHMNKLDNPLRRKILPPYKIIKRLKILEGQKIADVGCGIGYFTIPIAKVVGEKGRVYAIDINEKLLEEIKNRVSSEELSNIEIVHSKENDFRVEENTVDMIFTSTVYHELVEPYVFLNECKRIMKDGGRLIILDWNRIEEEMGPPIHVRKKVEDVTTELNRNGFDVQKVEYIENSFYIIHSSKK